jgi:Lrp/AsnC family transcriptional regulator, leucine-responsive regulatory protein
MQENLMDSTDRKILALLQKDGRAQNTEIANEVGLYPSSCQRRIKRLEEQGVIRQYVALLAPHALDVPTTVFAHIKIQNHSLAAIEKFESPVRDLPQVLECHLLMGSTDYILKLAVRDIEDYSRFLTKHIRPIPGIFSVESMASMREVKSTTALPI